MNRDCNQPISQSKNAARTRGASVLSQPYREPGNSDGEYGEECSAEDTSFLEYLCIIIIRMSGQNGRETRIEHRKNELMRPETRADKRRAAPRVQCGGGEFFPSLEGIAVMQSGQPVVHVIKAENQ